MRYFQRNYIKEKTPDSSRTIPGVCKFFTDVDALYKCKSYFYSQIELYFSVCLKMAQSNNLSFTYSTIIIPLN